MNPPCNRLKVINAERKWKIESVPTDNIKRVIVVAIARNQVAFLDTHLEFALLIFGDKRLWRTNIALAIWAMLQELSELVAVSLRRLNRRMGFNDEEARRFFEHKAMRNAARNHNIIALLERHFAEFAFQCATSLVNKDDFIGGTVAVVVSHLVGRQGDIERGISIEQNRNARREIITAA
jgi:hypothetical protein